MDSTTDSPPPADTGAPDERRKKRKGLILLAFLATPLLATTAVGIPMIIDRAGHSEPEASADDRAADTGSTPQIQAGEPTGTRSEDERTPEEREGTRPRGGDRTEDIRAGSRRDSADLESGSGARGDAEAGSGSTGGDDGVDEGEEGASSDPQPSPDPGVDPKPTPRPTPVAPSPPPGPVPTPTPTGGPGPSPLPTPDPGGQPGSGFGGETAQDATNLADARQLLGYSVPMNVTGNFDTRNAVWRVSAGALPMGLRIDPLQGTVIGVASAELGEYRFEITVDNGIRAVSGWFVIEVISAITTPDPGTDPTPTPAPDPSATPTPTPEPTVTPSPEPEPSATPSPTPTPEPTEQPTPEPTEQPTPTPTPDPTAEPTPAPTPTSTPAPEPSATPSPEPSAPTPTPEPTASPEPTPGPGTDPTPTPTPSPTPGTGEDGEDGSTIEPGDGGSQNELVSLTGVNAINLQIGEAVDQTYAAESKLGLSVRLRATDLPEWLSFENGQLTGTAPNWVGTLRLNVIAESLAGTSTMVVTVTVSAPKDTVTMGSSYTLDREFGAALSIETPARSSMGLPITYSAVDMPDWLTLSQEGVITGAAPQLVGTWVFHVHALTAWGATHRTITVNVAAPVDVLNMGSAMTQSFTFGSNILISTPATSKRGLPITYTVTDLPEWLSLSQEGVITGTAPDTVENVAFRVTATTAGGSTYRNITVRSVAPTDTLVMGASFSQTFAAGAAVSVSTPATSSLGLPISYGSTDMPSWLTITDGVITGTTPSEAPGDYTFRVTASTQWGSTYRIITIKVSPPKDTLLFVRGNGNESLTPMIDSVLDLDVSATSALGLPVAYSLTGGYPDWVRLDGSRLVGTAPSTAQASKSFYVVATTAYGTLSKLVSIRVAEPVDTVNFVNTAGTESFVATTGQPFEVSFPASSSMGLELTYSLTGTVPSWLSMDGDRLIGTAPATPQSTTAFSLWVKTKYGSKQKTVAIRVADPVDTLSFVGGNGLSHVDVARSGELSFDVSATSALGLEIAYTLAANAPAWVRVEGTRLVGTAPSTTQNRVYFDVIVTTRYGTMKKQIGIRVV